MREETQSLTLGGRAPQLMGEGPPHMRGAISYEDRFSWQAATIRTLKALLALALLAVVAEAAGLVWVAVHPKGVPYVVAVDKLQRALPVGPASEASLKSSVVVRTKLVEVVQKLRAVVPDDYTQRKNIDWVYAHLPKDSAAHGRVSQWYREVYEFNRGRRIEVDVVEVMQFPRSDDYEVQLLETELDKLGKTVGKRTVTVLTTVKLEPKRTFKDDDPNILGVYLTEVEMREHPWESQ